MCRKALPREKGCQCRRRARASYESVFISIRVAGAVEEEVLRWQCSQKMLHEDLVQRRSWFIDRTCRGEKYLAAVQKLQPTNVERCQLSPESTKNVELCSAPLGRHQDVRSLCRDAHRPLRCLGMLLLLTQKCPRYWCSTLRILLPETLRQRPVFRPAPRKRFAVRCGGSLPVTKSVSSIYT